VIITPARDEDKYIEYTLKSVCEQTLLPKQWIIVNDGSTDNTAALVKKYQEKYSWIKLVNNENKLEKRLSGAKVIRAFYIGYNTLMNRNYEFIVKLDADLILPENYFDRVSIAFKENSKVGLCGGYCVEKKNGKLIKKRTSKDHIRGAIKAYRKQCFEDIGGLKPILGWDGLDEMTAKYLGWEIKQLSIQVVHLRETNKEYKPLLHRFHSGMAYYRTGYGVILAMLKTVFWGFRNPYVIGGITFAIGYIAAVIKGEQKIGDKNMRIFFRRFKYNRVLQLLCLNNIHPKISIFWQRKR